MPNLCKPETVVIVRKEQSKMKPEIYLLRKEHPEHQKRTQNTPEKNTPQNTNSFSSLKKTHL